MENPTASCQMSLLPLKQQTTNERSMCMNKYFMSIDLGTSSVRAFIADLENRVYYSEGENYDVLIPRIGYAEQNPTIWYEKAVCAIKRVLKNSGIRPEDICAIGFSGQMHGTIVVDEACQPLMNAIIWMDQRSGETLEEINSIAGKEQITENIQNRMAAGCMVGTLYWFKTRKPELFSRIFRVMLPKDYIKFRLSGVIATDYSDAAGSLAFNNRELCWAKPLLEKLEIDMEIMPECLPSTAVVGHITQQAAQETGLSTNTLVINGGGDSFMQAIGNGIIHEGIFSSNIGTAGQISTTIDSPNYDKQLRSNTFAHVLPGRWQLMGGCLSGGISLNWVAKQILQDMDYAQVNQAVAGCPAGCNGLFFLPYLTGERTPHMDSKARGVFFGLTLDHGRADMERAAMEGVAYALKDCMNVLLDVGAKCNRIIAAGGGARSDIWLQIQADVFERDVYRSASAEQACLGAAITAAVGAGAYPDFETACDRCVDSPREVFHPQSKNVALYRRLYPIYREIYRKNKETFARIDAEIHRR